VCFLQVATVSVVVGLLFLLYRRRKGRSQESYLEMEAPRDTVILHQFGPGLHTPSISPFVLKLETFLRVAQIPYVNRFDRQMGPKGKLPWIQYNDHVVADSDLIIQFLSAMLDVKLSRRLSQQQAAVSHVIKRTAEEFTYWSLVLHRLHFDVSSSLYRKLRLPTPFIWYLRYMTSSRAHAQGIGRHSQAEVTNMTHDDLQSYSTFIGTKNFLFGEDKDDVTETDCALFGQLCELLWETPFCPAAEEAKQKFPNLEKFCHNMKEAFWPDWDDRLLPVSR